MGEKCCHSRAVFRFTRWRVELGKILTGRKWLLRTGIKIRRRSVAKEAPTLDAIFDGSRRVQAISEKLQSAENPFTSLFFADLGFLSSLISPRLDR